uniref:Cytidyltransferase-like domain-containing protein n=1 Tax=Polyblepharides amylifera TaxID=1486889 RepID=A0A7R9SVH5_9CHLO|mmetsp:Transcript_54/g.78  ORF Transcript_54/g.78 Transcript_54/m.78 type:complete len:219 (+) Transcript_54:65-721(+)|eukprot:CAMPEP_0196575334 /NCGR_PEP_ID=MMETSP1081-20130531/4834_1 /TAXON_ID=36882 /ORGANISM="Pyramimonas amylifera, Strain CCMP720" /LENGTH=218 /DNA_ID=CAMNT_0041893603 /DNA_START=29 /DNA_END=685 /DNA_ORIENTATION=-
MKSTRKVVIFGLSANPPTGLHGHTGIIRDLAGSFDEVWVLPVYRHIYESKSDLASFDHRVKMCQLSFVESDPSPAHKVSVCLMEKEIVEAAQKATDATEKIVRCGSIDVIRHLKARYPEVEWHWVLGADTYNDLRAGKWKASEEFQNEITIHVIPRLGDSLADLVGNARKRSITSLGGISSSLIRSSKNETFLRNEENLLPSVYSYIKEHNLYGWSFE